MVPVSDAIEDATPGNATSHSLNVDYAGPRRFSRLPLRHTFPMSVPGIASRVSPAQTAMRNTRDEGRSFEVGNQ
jgi:hypothetical protein